MGCNCGSSKKEFKELVKKSQSVQPQPVQQPVQQSVQQPMSRAERIRLRGLRIEARNQRMAARNASILAQQKKINNP